MSHHALRGRLFAALGITALSGADGCTRASGEGPVTAPPRDPSGRPVAVSDASATPVGANAASEPRPQIDPAALARIGWRAEDGGYVHTETRARPPEITRSPDGRGVYRRGELGGLVRVEVFTTEPPSPSLLNSPPPFGPFGMGGCGPPDVRCFEDRPAPAGEAAAALADRCPPARGYAANPGQRGALALEITRAERLAHRGDVCCYEWVRFCGGGRLLRRAGIAVLAPPVAEVAPVDPALEADLRASFADADERMALAGRWAREASFEHGSVRSFDEALDALRALGAPDALLVATEAARGDEVRHARALHALASAFAGTALGPGPLALEPVPAPSLAQFARDLFVEACVNETVAVAHAQAALTDPAILPTIAKILEPIVQDELAHAELAWRTLAWCLSSGDPSVRATIVEELSALEGELEIMGYPWDGLAPSVASRAGLLSARDRDRVRSLCAREVVVPCACALLDRAGPRMPAGGEFACA